MAHVLKLVLAKRTRDEFSLRQKMAKAAAANVELALGTGEGKSASVL